jgi:hypothetical protein
MASIQTREAIYLFANTNLLIVLVVLTSTCTAYYGVKYPNFREKYPFVTKCKPTPTKLVSMSQYSNSLI